MIYCFSHDRCRSDIDGIRKRWILPHSPNHLIIIIVFLKNSSRKSAKLSGGKVNRKNQTWFGVSLCGSCQGFCGRRPISWNSVSAWLFYNFFKAISGDKIEKLRIHCVMADVSFFNGLLFARHYSTVSLLFYTVSYFWESANFFSKAPRFLLT